MDTREKIVSPPRLRELLSQGQWTLVAGSFDPLTHAQAARLSEARRSGTRLAVLVAPAQSSLLPVEARAALVAAIRHVDAVAISAGYEVGDLPGSVTVVSDPQAEEARTQEFVDFILKRREGAAG